MAVPELWRTTRQRYSLHAEICPHCEEAVFPPRAVCPHCRREVRMQPVQQKASEILPSVAMTPAAIPMREFIYAMPHSNGSLASSVNAAIHAAMQSNGLHLVAAGDD